MSLQFAKYHGLGNDYLVIDPATFSEVIDEHAIRTMCDRHYGVGSDGILYGPLQSEQLFPKTTASDDRPDNVDNGVRIYNPDGSEAEKSGNGLRIFARFLCDNGYEQHKPFTVYTIAGPVRCDVSSDTAAVSVQMGKVSFQSGAIPMTGPEREVVPEQLKAGDKSLRFAAANVGNPHCVILDGEVNAEFACRYGPEIENSPQFPSRTNVQFMEVRDRHNIFIEIWERGARYTMASGTSACASAGVAVRLGCCESPVTVSMPGGELDIEFTGEYDAHLTGPVTRICHGAFAPELL